MDTLYIKAMFAGICFGIWPLFMNKSGLNAYAATTMFAGSVLVFALPAMFYSPGNVSQANWGMILSAGIFGALGGLFFNGAITKATNFNIGTLVVIQIIAQAAIAALYQAVRSGGMSWQKVCGFVLAAIAATILIKSK